MRNHQNNVNKSSGSKGKKNNNSETNRETAVITYFFLFLFLGMMAYFVWFMQVKSESFINSPYNKLTDKLSDRIIRGDIRSSDGEVLATSKVGSDGTQVREYPAGRMFAHVVGYNVNGKSGLENQANFDLLNSHEFLLKKVINDIRDQKNQGDSVVTTLNYPLQKAAYEALGDYNGAVIAMEPDTGKILAMVSKPDFNPNTLLENWEEVNGEGSSALYNRATQGKYTPGSVFKIFTLLEYYKENPKTYKNYQYDCDGTIKGKDGYTIHCAGHKSHGNEDLFDSFASSCNTSFANITNQLDLKGYNRLCNSLLFNRKLPISFESSQSVFSLSEKDGKNMIMQTGIGQGKTTVSPLHMMLVVSAAANEGMLMNPYLVDHVESGDGNIVSENKPKEYGKLMSKSDAGFLKKAMRSVVTNGTGGKLAGQSYTAYGKTGTAQVSDTDDTTNAWFAGYAQKDGKKIALAVIAEKAGGGSSHAVPIAKAMFNSYFE